MTDATNPKNSRRRDILVAASCGAFVVGMVGLAYASVPFYDWFCRTTGFGGRPQIAKAAPPGTDARPLSLRVAGKGPGWLPWKFEPEQNSIQVRLGEVVTVNYVATNLAARETV